MNTVHPGSTNDHHLDPERSLALRRAAKASFIGNFIEWFDYASYTYLASVIGIVFFPGGDKSARASGGICGVRYVVHSSTDRRYCVGCLGRPLGPSLGPVLVHPYYVGFNFFDRFTSATFGDWYSRERLVYFCFT